MRGMLSYMLTRLMFGVKPNNKKLDTLTRYKPFRGYIKKGTLFTDHTKLIQKQCI